MNEERINTKSRSPDIETKNENSLDARVSKSLTSSGNPETYG
jgi:hypothetical protein